MSWLFMNFAVILKERSYPVEHSDRTHILVYRDYRLLSNYCMHETCLLHSGLGGWGDFGICKVPK